MDSTMLHNLLLKLPNINNQTVICASDELAKYIINKDKRYLIVNNQPRNKNGQHWILIINDKTIYFFDPLGYTPAYYGVPFTYIFGYLIPNYHSNNIPYQAHNSKTCGLFCLYAILAYNKYNSLSILSSYFNQNTSLNEQIIIQFFKYHSILPL